MGWSKPSNDGRFFLFFKDQFTLMPNWYRIMEALFSNRRNLAKKGITWEKKDKLNEKLWENMEREREREREREDTNFLNIYQK